VFPAISSPALAERRQSFVVAAVASLRPVARSDVYSAKVRWNAANALGAALRAGVCGGGEVDETLEALESCIAAVGIGWNHFFSIFRSYATLLKS
jgi:hypothetical protein